MAIAMMAMPARAFPEGSYEMDLAAIGMIAAFFALSFAYIQACDGL